MEPGVEGSQRGRNWVRYHCGGCLRFGCLGLFVRHFVQRIRLGFRTASYIFSQPVAVDHIHSHREYTYTNHGFPTGRGPNQSNFGRRADTHWCPGYSNSGFDTHANSGSNAHPNSGSDAHSNSGSNAHADENNSHTNSHRHPLLGRDRKGIVG